MISFRRIVDQVASFTISHKKKQDKKSFHESDKPLFPDKNADTILRPCASSALAELSISSHCRRKAASRCSICNSHKQLQTSTAEAGKLEDNSYKRELCSLENDEPRNKCSKKLRANVHFVDPQNECLLATLEFIIKNAVKIANYVFVILPHIKGKVPHPATRL